MEPPILKPAPSEITKPCAAPSELPKRALTQQEVEFYWINDRENLVRCGISFNQLQEFYLDRDQRVSSS